MSTLFNFIQLHWLGVDRIRAYAAILGLVSLLSLVSVFREATGATGSDFLAFWSAGRLAGHGMAAASYLPAMIGAVQANIGRHEIFAFVNPPPFLLVLVPFGLLNYPVAWIAWNASTFAFWFAASRRLAPDLQQAIAAFPGALVALWHAQSGLLISALQALFARLLAQRPLLAGICIGALVIKPHLAVLVPIALAAGRLWRAFFGAFVTALGLLAISWLVFGTATLLSYPRSWVISRDLLATGDHPFLLRQATVYAAVQVASSPLVAAVAQAVCTATVGLLTWRTWATTGPLDSKIALLLASTPLATPYLFNYDLPFLIIPICWLAREIRTQPRGQWDRPALLMFYIAPLATRALALPLGANLMPWVSCWMVWMVWQRLHPRRDSAHVISSDGGVAGDSANSGGYRTTQSIGYVHPFRQQQIW